MKLPTTLITAAIGAVTLFSAVPAFAIFNYSVNYSDTSGNVSYPGATTITTTNAGTFFTLAPGGSITGSTAPTNVGLFTLTPFSNAAGPFAVNETHYVATFTLQTVTNLDGTGPIGSPFSFAITGDITGFLGNDSDNTTITVLTGLPKNFVAGGITYAVTLDSIRSPGVVSSEGNTGGVTLHIAPVPEPASLSLLGLGAVGLLARRVRRSA